MTVDELVAELCKFPPESRVVVESFDGGYGCFEDPTVDVAEVYRVSDSSGWWPRSKYHPAKEWVRAVVIGVE